MALSKPMRRWTIIALTSVVLAIIVGVVVWRYYDGHPLQDELTKIYMQALIGGLFGGVLVSFLNARREEDQRDMARDMAVRGIIEEIRAVHRRLKMVKRRLRSRITPAPDDGVRKPPFILPATEFERGMEDLLTAQIELEQVRDSVRGRDDLIDVERIERVYALLNYAARHAHDVYLTVEECSVGQVKGSYEIGHKCRNLIDFLGRRAWDAVPKTYNADEMTRQFDIMKNENQTRRERYAAFEALERLRQQIDGHPRYRIIATECVALAAADLQKEVRREKWRTKASRWVRRHN